MTVLYWVAAAAALASAIQAAGELARDRLTTLAAWVLSMIAVSASLALVAAVPAVLHGRPGAAACACAGFGVVGTWAFANVLGTTNSGASRIADVMAVPLAGGGCAALLLAGLSWAGSQDPHDAGLALAGVQLTLAVYYVPGLGRIAALARQRASLASTPWARVAMRAVRASANAETVLIMARSGILIADAFGMHSGAPVITVIGILQGVAAAYGLGMLAVGPVVMLAAAQCEPWIAYWRLRPLWAAVRQAVPAVEGSARTGVALSVQQRLLRRVAEIRAAEHALGPYWRKDVADRALAAAQLAGLSPGLGQAVVEATVIADAATARLRGEPPAPVPLPPERIYSSTIDDPDSQISHLVLVSRAIRHCPIIREQTTEPVPQ